MRSSWERGRNSRNLVQNSQSSIAYGFYGTTHRVGDDISTEQIIAPEQRSDDPAVLAAYCLAAIDPTLAERVSEGDVLVAGRGFGAGDDADIAVLALQALGFVAIICVSAAESFVEAATLYGLPVLVSEAAKNIAPSSVVRIDLERGQITDRATDVGYTVTPSEPALLDAVRRAQLLSRMRRVVEDEGFDG